MLFLHVFAFLTFHPFSRGSADPICPHVRTPMDRLLDRSKAPYESSQRPTVQNGHRLLTMPAGDTTTTTTIEQLVDRLHEAATLMSGDN